MTAATLQLILGLVALYGGGHYLVRGATAIALLLRASPAVVGLTVVALGTSMPELAVSIDAAARGATDIAYANIVGSNIFNIGAILGLAALMRPIPIKRQTVKIEYPFMVVVACLMVLLARDRLIDRLEGAFFLVSLALFLAYVVHLARREVLDDEAVALDREVRRAAQFAGNPRYALWRNLVLVGFGIAVLVGGADLVIRAAVTFARTWGVEERVIGLTIVAMGTSLPELATCIVAARRNQQEIALGNIVGSNIFNGLAILGSTAAIFPVPVHPRAIEVDNWVMLGFSVALFPLMFFGRRVSRRDGLLLLGAFLTYLTWLAITR